MDSQLLRLAETMPYTYTEVEKMALKCQTLYWPKEKAIIKCQEIFHTAMSFAISPEDSFDLQFQIDFTLL